MIDRLAAPTRTLAPFLVLLLAVSYASGRSDYLITVATITAIWSLLAVGLNFLMGYVGLINLGVGGFYAVGAYGAAVTQVRWDWNPWIALGAMPVLSFGIALAIGPIILRTKGLHFAVATLGIGIIVFSVLENWITWTGGPIGIPGIQRPGPIDLGIVEIDTATSAGIFWLIAVVLVVVLIGATVFHQSRVREGATRDA